MFAERGPDTSEVGGGGRAVAEGGEGWGEEAREGGDGRIGGVGNAMGDLEPLPLAPLPRALCTGDLPVPLGVPLAGDCLPPNRLPLPFLVVVAGGVVGAA